jgi:hypothetical protein
MPVWDIPVPPRQSAVRFLVGSPESPLQTGSEPEPVHDTITKRHIFPSPDDSTVTGLLGGDLGLRRFFDRLRLRCQRFCRFRLGWLQFDKFLTSRLLLCDWFLVRPNFNNYLGCCRLSLWRWLGRFGHLSLRQWPCCFRRAARRLGRKPGNTGRTAFNHSRLMGTYNRVLSRGRALLLEAAIYGRG